VNAPAVVVRFPLEGAPQVYFDTFDSGEEQRLRAWLEAHPDYENVIRQAIELALECRSA
jgi:hypothetical protein